MLENPQNSTKNQSLQSEFQRHILQQIKIKTGIEYSLESIKEELNIAYYFLRSIDQNFHSFSSDKQIMEFIINNLLQKLDLKTKDFNVDINQILNWFETLHEIDSKFDQIYSINELFSTLNHINSAFYKKTNRRKSLGIYYTPPELVQFMVESSLYLMKTYNIVDPINLLDFAAGYSIFPSIFLETLKVHQDAPINISDIRCFDVLLSAAIISEYISTHILKGYQKFNIHIENVLSEAFEDKHGSEFQFPVVLGNPPYSGHSKWSNKWTDKLIKPFQNESNSKILQKKWLHDDYVKFFGIAFHLIEKLGRGMVCFVTNSNYLDGDAFISFRNYVSNLFDTIFLLNLGGSKRRKKARGQEYQEKDDNIFNINQGVAVFLALKLSDKDANNANETKNNMFYYEIHGDFAQKIKFLKENSIKSIPWIPIPFHYVSKTLIPYEYKTLNLYESYISLDELLKMKKNRKIHTGLKTLHDDFAIGFTKDDIRDKVEKFLNTQSENEARALFNLCKQKQWNYDSAKKTLSKINWKDLIIPILYRPFDIRFTVYHDAVCKFRKPETSDLLLKPNSIALLISRKVKSNSFAHVFISAYPAEVIALSPQTSCNVYVFPIISDSESLVDFTSANRYFSNIGISFSDSISNSNDTTDKRYSSMDLLGWIYAILFSNKYRYVYSEFLCSDFPKIPMPENKEKFDYLSKLGIRLIELHLNQDKFIIKPNIDDNKKFTLDLPEIFKISKFEFYDEKNTLIINNNILLDSITKDIWEYRIGDYQPIKSYLKYRKTHNWPINHEDLNYIMNIANIIKQTLEIQHEIDEIIDLR